jgi:nucleotidyltransferase substrate binding protein (TIGR01987 family)
MQRGFMQAPRSQDIRWLQRFSNFKKALAQMRTFLTKQPLNELESQGLIQCFEYTHELAWKTLKDLLEFRGSNELFGSKDVTREAFKLDLIADGEAWMMMIQDRNQTSHTYNAATALAIVNNVRTKFFSLFEALEIRLDGLKDGSASNE